MDSRHPLSPLLIGDPLSPLANQEAEYSVQTPISDVQFMEQLAQQDLANFAAASQQNRVVDIDLTEVEAPEENRLAQVPTIDLTIETGLDETLGWLKEFLDNDYAIKYAQGKKHISSVFWKINEAILNNYFAGNAIQVGGVSYTISFENLKSYFRLAIENGNNYVAQQIWNCNEHLRSWYAGEAIIFNSINIDQIPFSDLLEDINTLANYHKLEILEKVFSKNEKAKDWFSGIVVENQKITLTEAISIFIASARSGKSSDLLRLLWDANQDLPRWFLNQNVIVDGHEVHISLVEFSRYFGIIAATGDLDILNRFWQCNQQQLKAEMKKLDTAKITKLILNVLSSGKKDINDFIVNFINLIEDRAAIERVLKIAEDKFQKKQQKSEKLYTARVTLLTTRLNELNSQAAAHRLNSSIINQSAENQMMGMEIETEPAEKFLEVSESDSIIQSLATDDLTIDQDSSLPTKIGSRRAKFFRDCIPLFPSPESLGAANSFFIKEKKIYQRVLRATDLTWKLLGIQSVTIQNNEEGERCFVTLNNKSQYAKIWNQFFKREIFKLEIQEVDKLLGSFPDPSYLERYSLSSFWANDATIKLLQKADVIKPLFGIGAIAQVGNQNLYKIILSSLESYKASWNRFYSEHLNDMLEIMASSPSQQQTLEETYQNYASSKAEADLQEVVQSNQLPPKQKKRKATNPTQESSIGKNNRTDQKVQNLLNYLYLAGLPFDPFPGEPNPNKPFSISSDIAEILRKVKQRFEAKPFKINTGIAKIEKVPQVPLAKMFLKNGGKEAYQAFWKVIHFQDNKGLDNDNAEYYSDPKKLLTYLQDTITSEQANKLGQLIDLIIQVRNESRVRLTAVETELLKKLIEELIYSVQPTIENQFSARSTRSQQVSTSNERQAEPEEEVPLQDRRVRQVQLNSNPVIPAQQPSSNLHSASSFGLFSSNREQSVLPAADRPLAQKQQSKQQTKKPQSKKTRQKTQAEQPPLAHENYGFGNVMLFGQSFFGLLQDPSDSGMESPMQWQPSAPRRGNGGQGS